MKVVYDTCLYIDFLRSGVRGEIFRDRTHIRYLSPIVMMELKAGAKNSKQSRSLDKLFNPYSKAERIIQLDSNHYFKGGECLSKIMNRRGGSKTTLSHDILIAISAFKVGATLFTSNKKDFQEIESYLPLIIKYV